MLWPWFLLSLAFTTAIPLQQSSLITLRTVVAPKSSGGNQPPPPTYGPLILEEWSDSTLLQSWTPSCTLPGLSSETWTEGRLSSRYPWGDQVWFLCRSVPVNSPLSTNPAPVAYMNLQEDGTLGVYVEESLYPNGTNLVNILPYTDTEQGINVFYLLGGGTQANGPTSPARPAQARIRVDSGQGQPPDAQGALLSSTTGITLNQLRILNHTLYGVGLNAGSIGLPSPAIYQIGQGGVLPTGTRTPSTLIPNFPLILSVWTDPFSDLWWRTGLNRSAYLARHDNADGSDQVFPLPPSASAGTLGGVSWSIASARQEGSEFAIYLTNTSHLVKNTLNGLQSGLPYQPVLQAPPGWRYLSAHARNPILPSPSATSTATATATPSASASASASAVASASATATASPTSTAGPTTTSTGSPVPTSSSSPSASASASSSATASRDPQRSPNPSLSSSPTPSTSNGTLPVPPAANAYTDSAGLSPGETTGISLGAIAVVCVAGILLVHYSPTVKRLYTRQFGASVKSAKKGVSFRTPVSSDLPITINHNPQAILQQRLDQLRQLQKQQSTKEIAADTRVIQTDRTKKEFGPVVSGDSV